jgi:hypothetical protein
MPARRVRHLEIDDVLELTFDSEPKTRSHALRELCPCHIKSHDDRIWQRIFAMAGDPDVRVRRTVIHALADGSPRVLEPQVIATLESMRADPDERTARTVRRLLDHYRRTGKINVL